jgi:hypothetical protein
LHHRFNGGRRGHAGRGFRRAHHLRVGFGHEALFLGHCNYPVIEIDRVGLPCIFLGVISCRQRPSGLVVHEKREKDDDRQWYSQQPQKRASSKAHDSLHFKKGLRLIQPECGSKVPGTPQTSKSAEQNQNEHDNDHEAEAAAAIVAGAVERTAAQSAEPPEKRDDENDEDDCPE